MTTTPTQYESVDARCTCGWRSKPTTASAAIGLAAAHRRRWENLHLGTSLHSFQHETTVGPVTLDADVQALAAAAKHQYAAATRSEAIRVTGCRIRQVRTLRCRWFGCKWSDWGWGLTANERTCNRCGALERDR